MDVHTHTHTVVLLCYGEQFFTVSLLGKCIFCISFLLIIISFVTHFNEILMRFHLALEKSQYQVIVILTNHLYLMMNHFCSHEGGGWVSFRMRKRHPQGTSTRWMIWWAWNWCFGPHSNKIASEHIHDVLDWHLRLYSYFIHIWHLLLILIS